MSSLPPPPPGPARSGGTRRWLVVGVVAVVLLLVVGVVAALSFGRGDSTADPRPSDPDGGASEGPSNGETTDDDVDQPDPEDLQRLTRADLVFPEMLGPVCEGTAVITDAAPFPDAPRQLADLSAEALLHEPRLDPPLDDTWGASIPPDEAAYEPGYAGLNAVVCVDALPGTAEVRETCEGELYDGTPGTWEVYSSDYEIFTVDPTTGEEVGPRTSFTSTEVELPGNPDLCELPPVSLDVEPETRKSDLTLPAMSTVLRAYFDDLVAS